MIEDDEIPFDSRLKRADQFNDEALAANAISAIEDDYSEMSTSVWFVRGRTGEKIPKYLQLHQANTDGGERIISALKNNSHISRLGFGYYDLSDVAMEQLKEVLATNQSLTSITFYHGTITLKGIKHLAKALENSPYLTKIRFLNVPLDDEGVKILADALKKNRSLTTVSFDQTALTVGPWIGKEGAVALLEGLNENYHITEFNFEHINELTEKPVREGKEKFLERNGSCFRRCLKLDEDFNSLDKQFKFLEGNSTPAAIKAINHNVGNRLPSMKGLISYLEATGYPVDEWQRKVIRTELKLNILSHEMDFVSLFDAYLKDFSDGTDQIMNEKLARALFSYLEKNEDEIISENKDENEAIELLGFDRESGCRWLLKLLKGNDSKKADEIRQYAYTQLHGKDKAKEEWEDTDRSTLTVAELEVLKNVLTHSTDPIFEKFKLNQHVKSSEINDLTNDEERFAANILNELNNSGVLFTIYEQWMLRGRDKRDEFLPVPNYYKNYYGWFKIFRQQFEAAKRQEAEWEASFFEKLHKSKISRDIANVVGNGAYENVLHKSFNVLHFSSNDINTDHSRTLSAYRMSTESFGHSEKRYTYEDIVRILQVEYHALPDQDKVGAFHYTFWRNCTLEHWLEKVFKDNNIMPLRSENLSEAEKLASFLLSWVGDQERSFAYKVLKNQRLPDVIAWVGRIAHSTILSSESNFEDLKADVIKDLRESADEDDKDIVDALVSEILQKFPDPPHPKPK